MLDRALRSIKHQLSQKELADCVKPCSEDMQCTSQKQRHRHPKNMEEDEKRDKRVKIK